jgi:hypothetical protein
VKVNAVPTPVAPRDRRRLDGARGSEVIVITTTTAIWIAPIDVPISIVSRATSTRTTDRRYTATTSSRAVSVTTTTMRIRGGVWKTGDIRRVVTITIMRIRGTASADMMLVTPIRGIGKIRSRARWRSRGWSTNGR